MVSVIGIVKVVKLGQFQVGQMLLWQSLVRLRCCLCIRKQFIIMIFVIGLSRLEQLSSQLEQMFFRLRLEMIQLSFFSNLWVISVRLMKLVSQMVWVWLMSFGVMFWKLLVGEMMFVVVLVERVVMMINVIVIVIQLGLGMWLIRLIGLEIVLFISEVEVVVIIMLRVVNRNMVSGRLKICLSIWFFWLCVQWLKLGMFSDSVVQKLIIVVSLVMKQLVMLVFFGCFGGCVSRLLIDMCGSVYISRLRLISISSGVESVFSYLIDFVLCSIIYRFSFQNRRKLIILLVLLRVFQVGKIELRKRWIVSLLNSVWMLNQLYVIMVWIRYGMLELMMLNEVCSSIGKGMLQWVLVKVLRVSGISIIRLVSRIVSSVLLMLRLKQVVRMLLRVQVGMQMDMLIYSVVMCYLFQVCCFIWVGVMLWLQWGLLSMLLLVDSLIKLLCLVIFDLFCCMGFFRIFLVICLLG